MPTARISYADLLPTHNEPIEAPKDRSHTYIALRPYILCIFSAFGSGLPRCFTTNNVFLPRRGSSRMSSQAVAIDIATSANFLVSGALVFFYFLSFFATGPAVCYKADYLLCARSYSFSLSADLAAVLSAALRI